MQTILVPTDFSPSGYNIARYAIAFANNVKATRIVLYNAYMPFVSDDTGLGTLIIDTSEDLRKISIEGLSKMKEELQAEAPGLQIEFENDVLPVEAGIEEACKKFNPGLIVMGVSGSGSNLMEALGSNAVDIARHSKIPTLIVSPQATYNGLKKIFLASDFKDVTKTTPADTIKKLLDDTGAQLHVLHVETGAADAEAAAATEKNKFDSIFSGYNPEYHFIKGKVFTDTVNEFSVANNADLIIIIPKKHSWFEGIFSYKHTKALAFHSNTPLLAVHV